MPYCLKNLMQFNKEKNTCVTYMTALIEFHSTMCVHVVIEQCQTKPSFIHKMAIVILICVGWRFFSIEN